MVSLISVKPTRTLESMKATAAHQCLRISLGERTRQSRSAGVFGESSSVATVTGGAFSAHGPRFLRITPGSRLLCAEPCHADPHGEVLLLLGAELEAQDLVDEVAVGEVALRG